ncbi:MAG: glycosyltransferase family 1 protein [Chloroflexota bacterium]|nr:MAG: glycosyltransferase family 1 protein [Chloroflexota bacterium]
MANTRIALLEQTASMGGVEFSTLYLAQHLDSELFHPIVICPEEGDLTRLCRQRGVEIHVVPRAKLHSVSLRRGRHYAPNPLAMVSNTFALLNGAIRLRAFLRQHEVDLICTKGLLAHVQGGLTAKLANVPCVWHVQDAVSDRAMGLYRRLLRVSAAFLADHVIADGPTILEQMPRKMRASRRVSLIYNGVDVEEFAPTADGKGIRQELGMGEEHLVVGSVARLTPWKGQAYLLHAAARLSREFARVHFLIVGSPLFASDSYELELRAIAAAPELVGRVSFAGYRLDLPNVLAAIDIFAYTALEKDTSPLALLSAMAAGKPIVAPDISGVRELFSDGIDGILVPPANVDRLADALRLLLTDEGLRTRLGQRARERAVGEFSVQSFAQSCEEVFASVLERQRSGRAAAVR